MRHVVWAGNYQAPNNTGPRILEQHRVEGVLLSIQPHDPLVTAAGGIGLCTTEHSTGLNVPEKHMV